MSVERNNIHTKAFCNKCSMITYFSKTDDAESHTVKFYLVTQSEHVTWRWIIYPVMCLNIAAVKFNLMAYIKKKSKCKFCDCRSTIGCIGYRNTVFVRKFNIKFLISVSHSSHIFKLWMFNKEILSDKVFP